MTEHEYDIHIKGGTVVDGTRVPRYKADVWIRDGKIVQIGGRVTGSAEQVIERIRRYVDLGVRQFVIEFFGRDIRTPASLFAERVLPAFS